MQKNQGLDQGRLRRLVEFGRSLVSELDLEVVLNMVLEAARDLTGARYAALGILDDEREELEQFLTLGIDDEKRREIGALPRGRGVLGLLIRDPAPLRLDDVGSHARSYGFPPGHPPMSGFLGVPILIRGEAWGNIYLTEKEGGEFNDADQQAVVVLADWAAIGIQNARLYSGLEDRRNELEHAVRGLEATTEIARALSGQTKLKPILDTVAKRARALVEARSLMVLLPDRKDLVVVAGAGELAPDSEELRLPINGSTPGMVLRSREADRFSELGPTFSSQPHSQGTGSAALMAPLLFRGQAVGVLVAVEPLGERPVFTEDDQRVLVALSLSAATAIATAQSLAEDRSRQGIQVAERERARWARELHDEPLQDLAGLRLLLASAKRSDPEDAERLLTEAEGRVDETIGAMRRVIADLRPAALDELGLEAALEALVERVTTGTDAPSLGVEVNVNLASEQGRAPARFAAETEEAMYRVVQEALNNAIHHSGADKVTIQATKIDENVVELKVIDDGKGFDIDEETTGFGLRSMRERAALVGGVIEVQSAPNEGTTIKVTIPAERRSEEAA
ncbi:MAG: GAF domain-containing protein [Solirubrobacterales bacterium]